MHGIRFSRVGFVLAAAGSAVGLGNVWKFSYMAGQNGGGAFVLVYLATILFFGVALFLGEVVIGRLSRKDPVSAYRELAPRHGNIWQYSGLVVFAGIMILSFYTVVMGWIFKYIFLSFGQLPNSAETSGKLFGSVVGANPLEQVAFFTFAFFLVFYIVSKGLKKGIEKINVILMPLLVIILIILFFYAINLEGFGKAVNFLFTPDFNKIGSTTILEAMGQAFFTLSLGVGTIMTYAASLPKHANLYRSSLLVALMDTFIALFAGIIIFAFTFHFDVAPSEGPSLVFISLPPLFNKLNFLGHVISILFFVALAFAGITSAVSMVEPTIAFLTNNTKMTRKQSLVLIGIVVYILGLLSLFSNVANSKEYLTFFGKGFFDILDFLTSSIIMPLSGISVAIFVGFVIQKERLQSLLMQNMGAKVFSLWYFTIRFVVPIGVFLIMLDQLF